MPNRKHQQGTALVIPLVKDPPSNAGDADSIPDRGNNIPCAAEQLSPPATTGEAHVLQQRPGTAKKKEEDKEEAPAGDEKPAAANGFILKLSPCLLTFLSVIKRLRNLSARPTVTASSCEFQQVKPNIQLAGPTSAPRAHAASPLDPANSTTRATGQ